MLRKNFIKLSGLSTIYALLAPSALARHSYAGTRKENTIICILNGGVRLEEFKHFSGLYAIENSSIKPIKYKSGALTHSAAIYSIINGRYSDIETDVQLPHLHSGKDIRELLKKMYGHKAPYFCTIGNADKAHYNYMEYCNDVQESGKLIKQLWSSIQENGFQKNNTTVIVLPEHGRNIYKNEMGGLDHYHESARDSFCFILGNNSGNKLDAISENTQIRSLLEDKMV